MKGNIYCLIISILISFFLVGCYTQLDLVDRTEDTYYYYVETEEGDSVLVEEYYRDYYWGYDPYYDFYWDPWYPQWGLFIGYYPWYPWRYRYYHPFYYGWYYNYYPYWYYPRYAYAYKRNFNRRTFDRRSPYQRTANSNKIVTRSPGKKLVSNDNRSLERNKKRIVVDSRRRVRPFYRNDRHKYHPRPVIRKSNGRSYHRNSSSRRPSLSGRSSSVRSSTRGSITRSSRNSSSGRSSGSSSRRPSRR